MTSSPPSLPKEFLATQCVTGKPLLIVAEDIKAISPYPGQLYEFGFFKEPQLSGTPNTPYWSGLLDGRTSYVSQIEWKDGRPPTYLLNSPGEIKSLRQVNRTYVDAHMSQPVIDSFMAQLSLIQRLSKKNPLGEFHIQTKAGLAAAVDIDDDTLETFPVSIKQVREFLLTTPKRAMAELAQGTLANIVPLTEEPSHVTEDIEPPRTRAVLAPPVPIAAIRAQTGAHMLRSEFGRPPPPLTPEELHSLGF